MRDDKAAEREEEDEYTSSDRGYQQADHGLARKQQYTRGLQQSGRGDQYRSGLRKQNGQGYLRALEQEALS